MSLPILELYIELPFLLIHTSLMRRVDMGRYINYVQLGIKLFKWEFSFRLYDCCRKNLK